MSSAWIPLAERGPWLAALEGIDHGFAHRPEYSAATAHASGHEPGLWAWQGRQGRAICALGRRPAPGGGFDIATPLGFGGFAIEGSTDGLVADWTRFWREAGALDAYVQLSPARLATDWQSLLGGEGVDLRGSRECWLWDLRPSPAELLAGMHANHRRFLQQWLESPPVLAEDADELRPAFLRLYADFVEARDVGAYYRFKAASLVELDAAPGVHWLGARDAAGEIEAVVVFLRQGACADLFLATSTPEGRRHSRGLYWSAALRLRERGVATINLGGGIVDGDSLAQFKRRFGATSRPTLALRQVFDPPGFARACASARVDPDAAGRFPPWLGA